MNETIKLLVVTGVLAVGGVGLLMYNNNTEEQEQAQGKNKKHKKQYGGIKNETEQFNEEEDDDSLSESDDDSLSESDDDSISESDDNNKSDNNWLDLRSYFGNKKEQVPNYNQKQTKGKTKTIKQKERNNKTKIVLRCKNIKINVIIRLIIN